MSLFRQSTGQSVGFLVALSIYRAFTGTIYHTRRIFLKYDILRVKWLNSASTLVWE